MKTKEIIEHLLFKNNNLRFFFQALGIISYERKFTGVEHPEFENILKDFETDNANNYNLSIFSIANIIQTTYIISNHLKNRKYPIIKIQGYKTEILELSKTGILSEFYSCMRIKDFLPDSLVKKIIYFKDLNIEDTSNIGNIKKALNKGLVFSEFRKNQWTIEDPLEIEIQNSNNCTYKDIFYEILEDFKN